MGRTSCETSLGHIVSAPALPASWPCWAAARPAPRRRAISWCRCSKPIRCGPSPCPITGSSARPSACPPTPVAGRQGGGERGIYHDSCILKFTPDGKFLGEIGHANGSKGSLDTENVKGVAQIRFLPGTNELVAADGYGNHRVSVWDAAT